MTEYFSAFSAVAISADGKLAATASYRYRIEIWNAHTGELIQRSIAGNDITVLEFAESGKMLASGHADGRVLLWDTGEAWEKAEP